MRHEAYPVSWPSSKGEFVLTASRIGNQGAIRSAQPTPSSGESMATCTCIPQVVPRRATWPNVSAMSR